MLTGSIDQEFQRYEESWSFFSEYFTIFIFEFLDVSYVSRQNVQLVTNCPNLHAQHIQTKVHFDNNVYIVLQLLEIYVSGHI